MDACSSASGGEAALSCLRRARKYLVERMFGWLYRYRRLLVRHEHYAFLYDGFLHLACALIAISRFGHWFSSALSRRDDGYQSLLSKKSPISRSVIFPFSHRRILPNASRSLTWKSLLLARNAK
ncbi:hypothetical protein SH668x_003702 [Planctomicrobium sp. SH668]|jgi:hypothetical protein|uniref:hypothetical protein n=1 Tax=Planctomicrobium sp. SH668 TaxID=3448126 RepID=UPI003F5B2393